METIGTSHIRRNPASVFGYGRRWSIMRWCRQGLSGAFGVQDLARFFWGIRVSALAGFFGFCWGFGVRGFGLLRVGIRLWCTIIITHISA